ncbi:hypothetical protein SAMN05444064_10294 [Pseudomonas syringae]|uniref:hypothetical protein n=1 Tax=Pseudomonas syringae TaxID=317 RepID=UPI000898CEA0|nr:hypothetical protein [Pseudomonas syringae]SDW28403.1 hypothetical protein SAMN05444514_102315 [Pseudomonas syringae]SFL51315.1 hypothetical protein SAMN05444064_10294 [Pseudomonas syringae]
MKNKKNKAGRAFVSGLLLAMSCHATAQVEGAPTASEQPIPQEQTAPATGNSVPVVLTDKIHQINKILESTTVVHQYDFTAARGQNVLIATPDHQYNQTWRLEYQVDGGEWQAKRHNGAEKISGLNAGSQVNIRILATEGARFDSVDYSVVFGSYPHMRYDLHNEEGFLPIPHGRTTPAFLGAQAFTKAMLEATFTDSTGIALEGGVLDFHLSIREGGEGEQYISDSSGKIMQLLTFKGCEGGQLADNFVHYSNGKNTWSTRYEVGDYWAVNRLLENLADKPYVYKFGHICKRWLINWSRN